MQVPMGTVIRHQQYRTAEAITWCGAVCVIANLVPHGCFLKRGREELGQDDGQSHSRDHLSKAFNTQTVNFKNQYSVCATVT